MSGFTVCAETCGFCVDKCEDIFSKFFIGDDIRDSLWLQLRPKLKSELCQASSDHACLYFPETCDVCDVPSKISSAQPVAPSQLMVASAAPVSPVKAVVLCDDEQRTFFLVPDIASKYQRCIRWAARPERQVDDR